jgi:hypothetical protein
MHKLLYNAQLYNAYKLPTQDAVKVLRLETALHSSGLWDKIESFFPLAGNTKETQSINLRNPSNPLVFTGDNSAAFTAQGLKGQVGMYATFQSSPINSSCSLGLGGDSVANTSRDLKSNNTPESRVYLNYAANISYVDLLTTVERVNTTNVNARHLAASRGPSNGTRFTINGVLQAPVGALTAETGLGNTSWRICDGSTRLYRYFFLGYYMTLEELNTMYTIVKEYSGF